MIIIQNSSKETNIIKCIIGPETDFQFDVAGFVAIDLSAILARFEDKSLPVHMVFTRSLNETATSEMIEEASNNIRGRLQDFAQRVMSNDLGGNNNNHQNEDEPQKPAIKLGGHDDPRGQWEPKIICPKCGAKGVFLKEGAIAICGDCLKIEKGLGNIKSETTELKHPSSKTKKKTIQK